MREVTVTPRELLGSRVFWLCVVALAQGALFLLCPGLPASLELVSGVALVVLLAGAIGKKDQADAMLEPIEQHGPGGSAFCALNPQRQADEVVAPWRDGAEIEALQGNHARAEQDLVWGDRIVVG